MRVIAPAKVNLLLSVTPGVDLEGYHRVDSVMQRLGVGDEVEVVISPTPGIHLRCIPDPLPAGADPRRNLAWRAAWALADLLGVEPAIDIDIRKVVPSQAGLGGGSSDAAAVIRCLCRLWGHDHGDADVLGIARRLGADVPFFLYDEDVVVLDGRGDRMSAAFPGFRTPVVLVKPPCGVPTGDAYRLIDELAHPAGDPAPMLAALAAGSEEGMIASIANDFSSPARIIAPGIGEVFSFLDGCARGRGGAFLCGSGSCVAMFTRDIEDAGAIAAGALERGWWSMATRLAGWEWGC